MTVRLILKPPHDQTKRTNQDDQLGCKAHFFCESSAASRRVEGDSGCPKSLRCGRRIVVDPPVLCQGRRDT